MNIAKKDLIACMGEVLIDMVQESTNGNTFEAHPGGAPANVAVGISRLGGRSAFMGKVGRDKFGDFLENTLIKDGVNTVALKHGGKTGMAVVSLEQNRERSFEFYEKLITYSELDVDLEILDESIIFHFGSISLIGKAESLATLKCLKYAKDKGLLISYDPNIRLGLWEGVNIAREGIRVGLGYADILKISGEELEFLTGEKGIEKGIQELIKINPNVKIVAVTLGASGSYCWYKGEGKAIPAIKVEVVDTTGAGDGFMAGLLYSLQKNKNFEDMSWDEVINAFKLANMVGSLTTTKKGAITALPFMKEVRAYCIHSDI